jgi:hypothetical protein
MPPFCDRAFDGKNYVSVQNLATRDCHRERVAVPTLWTGNAVSFGTHCPPESFGASHCCGSAGSKPSVTSADKVGTKPKLQPNDAFSRVKETMSRILRVSAAILILPVWLIAQVGAPSSNEDLLKVREKVWRAWFAGDTKTLEELVPPETIVMSGGEEKWKNQADVLRTAAEFHAKGGKLVRLEFSRTEVQHFGDVAIIWSSYHLEIEVDHKRSSGSSRVTEVFVWQHGRWTNPGWHTDEEK